MTAKRSKRPEQSDGGDDRELVFARALNLLARREHSRQELRAKLVQRGVPEALAEAVTGELVERNLLNEGRFIEAFVRSRVERGYGPLKIEAELRARGIAEGVSAHLFDWIALARGARDRRFGRDHPRDWRERARQMRFLQQRGFDGSQIRAVFTGIDD